MKFTILDLVKSQTAGEIHHAAAAKAGKWYDKYLQSGGRWVTIKEGPLEGRHILIDGHGYVAGGKGIPKKLLDKWNGNRHKDNLPPHGPSAPHGPEGPPYPAPEPTPAPAPAGDKGGKGEAEPELNEAERLKKKLSEAPPSITKAGYGDGATMHVVDGTERTIKHIKNLKHVHGGKWNAEHQQWEFNHAHDSEGHKALHKYVENAGLKLNLHENSEGGEAPAPTPAPAPSVSNEGGKAGKVTIGGNSYPHKFALKSEHGAQWNKDSKAWEVPDVAHGSAKHKAIQDFANERGLTANHEHDEKPAAPEKSSRDMSKETMSDLVKNMPTNAEIADHLLRKMYDNPADAPDSYKSRTDRKALEVSAYLNSFKKNPHLLKHADDTIKHKHAQGVDFDPLAEVEDLHNRAELAHAEAEVARKNKEREKETEDYAKGIGAKPLEGELGNWIQNPPDVAAIKSHFMHKYIEGYRSRVGRMPESAYIDSQGVQYQAKAAEAHDALHEIKKNPALHQHVLEYLRSQSSSYSDPLENLKRAVEVAKTKVRMKVHKTAEGKTVEVDPEGHRYGLPSGSGLRKDSYTGSKVVNAGSRSHYVPMPKDMKKFTKEHVAKYVEGAGDEAHAFIHHVLSGNTEPFTYGGGTRVKPTVTFKPFAAPPDKNKAGYMDEAKGDMMAHGARAVVFSGGGNAEQRASAAQTMASGMRALHHLTGGGIPPVELVVGTIKGSALAHYRAGYRSITIDAQKGRNHFFHEYGHFIDDAMHGFRGLDYNSAHVDTAGNYNSTTPFQAIARELSNTKAHKDKLAEHEGKGYDRKFKSYYKQDKELFARFFARWLPHEAKKQGVDLPPELDERNIDGRMKDYSEDYSPEELDKVGEMLKKALKDKGLWKGFEAFLLALGGKRPDVLKFVISV